jgi:cytochrome c peroxidase
MLQRNHAFSGLHAPSHRGLLLAVAAGIPIGIGALSALALPPVPVPTENPITESKRVLGKMLFFEEQLSTSNAVSCASCHVSGAGGADPRLFRNPGPDGISNTPDDRLASPGIVQSDSNNDFVHNSVFGVGPQVGDRAAPSPIDAAFAPVLFWDGRATSQFIDPETSQVAINNGGALESQCVAPPLNTAEMAHAGFNWSGIEAKLNRVHPLDLVTNLPADLSSALASNPSYGQLFASAFGDSAITSRRVAFAIATYERTLIADQTPLDAFQAGNNAALTPQQINGFNTMQGVCTVCHAGQLFTDQTFRNIGVRPPSEDLGRQNISGNTGDRGKFKVPSLRNVNLKKSFMHGGQFSTLDQVVAFYAKAPTAPPMNPDNLDPAAAAIRLNPGQQAAVVAFLNGGLTDPRVANQQFPFDRPTLFTERPANRSTIITGGEVAGSGGVVPTIIAPDPAMVGNIDHRIGIDGAAPGATAHLGLSSVAPVNGVITPQRYLIETTVPASGTLTMHWALTPGEYLGGQTLYVQWFVDDTSATDGIARSAAVQVPLFCGRTGCITVSCYANCDGSTQSPTLSAADFSCFLAKFRAGDAYANCDGSTGVPTLTASDFSCFLGKFRDGCS